MILDKERMAQGWFAETKRMRSHVNDSAPQAVQILADYLNEFAGERLVVTRLNASMTAQNTKPTHGISSRYEIDAHLMWISCTHIKAYLGKHHFDFYDLRDDLAYRRILVNRNSKKVLGAGTDYNTGLQTLCWEIKTDHPELKGVME